MNSEHACRRINPCGTRHRYLTGRLYEIGDVGSKIKHNDDRLFTTSGKLKVHSELLKELDIKSKQLFHAYRSMTSSMGKRALVKLSSGRARKLDVARSSWETEYARERRVRDEVRVLHERLERCKAEKAILLDQRAEMKDLTDELEEMYESIFGTDGLPDWPHEQAASSWHAINLETTRFLSAEQDREKRGRDFLIKSKKHAADICNDLQSSLQVCIDTGIATNTRYNKQLFQGNSPAGTSRACIPMLLAAKTNSGKLHTTYAEARGAQQLIRLLPELHVLELYKMPARAGSSRTQAVSEAGLHRSLESSYAQSKVCASHIQREVYVSKERSRLLARAKGDLAAETAKSLAAQRSIRAEIVETVLRGAVVVPPPLGHGEGWMSAEDVRLRAKEALRQIVRAVAKEASGDLEEETLPDYQTRPPSPLSAARAETEASAAAAAAAARAVLESAPLPKPTDGEEEEPTQRRRRRIAYGRPAASSPFRYNSTQQDIGPLFGGSEPPPRNRWNDNQGALPSSNSFFTDTTPIGMSM